MHICIVLCDDNALYSKCSSISVSNKSSPEKLKNRAYLASNRASTSAVLMSSNTQTSRERPKSAPYLRLKKTRKRKPLFLQLETTKALKKLKIEKKNFRINSKFFEVSGKSHSAEKRKRGFFEHPFCCKISKIDGRNNKKNR